MKIIDEFDIGDTMKLKLQVGEYRDKERIDLRQFVKVDNSYIPTKKGISISAEWIDKLIVMVNKLKDI